VSGMRSEKYLNFDLAIETADDGYLATVRASPVGEARGSFDLPFTPEGLELLVLRLSQSRTTVRRGQSTSQVSPARDFGRTLYEAVFAGEVEFAFRRSLEEAERCGKGLRLRLRLDRAPDLIDLPWELLYSTTLYGPLVLFENIPLVRYIELPSPPRPLEVVGPLQILVVVAAPTDLIALDAEDELARIADATGDLQEAGFVHVDHLTGATLPELVRRLRKRPCHVLHFVGHGGYGEHDGAGDGVLAFEDDERRHHLVSGHDLGVLLRGHRTLRLAVLNSCDGARTSPTDPFAGVAQSLVRQGIPAVVAMQFEITDTAARLFSHELYRALIDGSPVDEALGIARQAVFAADSNSVEWATPVLYLRSSSGHIFAVPEVDTTALIPVVRAEPQLADEHEQPSRSFDGADAAPGGAVSDSDSVEDVDPGHGDIDGHGELDAHGQRGGRRHRPRPNPPPRAPSDAPTDEPWPKPSTNGEAGLRARRNRVVMASSVGVAVLAAGLVWLFGPPPPPPPPLEADVVVSWLDSPTITADGLWAADLERYPTSFAAEGEARPQVSSEWAFGWDDDALYLFVEVTDAEVSTPYAARPWLMFRGDGINLQFGRDPSGLTDDALLRDDDVQVIIGPAEPGAGRAVVATNPVVGDAATCVTTSRHFGKGSLAPEITTAITGTPNGYRVAAAVPWGVLGRDPRAGELYAAVMTVADVDPETVGDPLPRGSRSSIDNRVVAKRCPGRWDTLTLLPSESRAGIPSASTLG
jgi:hypothetical protein